MKQLNDIINKYINGELTLFDFENEVLEFPITPLADDFINELLEDIAYTTTVELTEEDKRNSLMSESDLKNKLKVYLNQGGNL